MFEALIYPLTKQQFYENIYAQRAMVIRCGKHGPKRIVEIIKQQMFGLNLPQMLKNSCSESIHVWNMPGQRSKDKAVASVEASPTDAYKAYRAGASLYFGSSPDFRDLYMKFLNMQMGQSFGGYYHATHNDISLMQ